MDFRFLSLLNSTPDIPRDTQEGDNWTLMDALVDMGRLTGSYQTTPNSQHSCLAYVLFVKQYKFLSQTEKSFWAKLFSHCHVWVSLTMSSWKIMTFPDLLFSWSGREKYGFCCSCVRLVKHIKHYTCDKPLGVDIDGKRGKHWSLVCLMSEFIFLFNIFNTQTWYYYYRWWSAYLLWMNTLF